MLKRVLEGFGYPVGIYEDAARTVVWHEMNGLDGLEELRLALPEIDSGSPVFPEIMTEDENLIVVDAYGGSCITVGGLLVEIACARAISNDLAIVQVRNCRNRCMILERLHNASQRGLSFAAYWLDNGVVNVTTMTDAAGVWMTYDAENWPLGNSGSMSIVSSPSMMSVQSHLNTMLSPDSRSQSRITVGVMQTGYERAIEQGISVDEDLWGQLEKLVARILVPATQLSRTGAGPG